MCNIKQVKQQEECKNFQPSLSHLWVEVILLADFCYSKRKRDVLLPLSGKSVARAHLDGWVGSLWFIFVSAYDSLLFYVTQGLDIKEGLERSGPRKNYTRNKFIGFVGLTWTRVVLGMKEVCIVLGCPKPESVILPNSLPGIVPIDPYESREPR